MKAERKINVKKSVMMFVVMFFGLVASLLNGEKAFASSSSQWAYPTENYTISATWPKYSGGSYHSGIDFAVPLNTPVYSTCDGTVVATGSLTTSYGVYVKIKATVNGETVYMRYCHLNSYIVQVGDKVKAGQKIAYSGSTGNSTGPHLHYEVRNASDSYGDLNNPTLNPSNYLPGSSYQYTLNTNDPIGYIDSVSGGTNAITLRGWAFDLDVPSNVLELHVYVGGPAGSGAPAYAIYTGAYRPDVAKAYSGVGNYQGFEQTISVDKNLVGEQTIYIYAINQEGTNNPFIGSRTVVIYPEFTYYAHVANIGNLTPVSVGEATGDIGKNRIEDIVVNLTYGGKSAIIGQAHVKDKGWLSPVGSGCSIGTRGLSLRIECVNFKLTNGLENKFDLYYRVYVNGRGWTEYAKNGENAGTTGLGLAISGIQFKLEAK